MKWYQSAGRLIYFDTWCVVQVDRELGLYYNWWCNKFLGRKTNIPQHGFHITVVAGKYDEANDHKRWGKRQNQKVRFQYSSVIFGDRDYYFLKVKCPLLRQIRKELGLKPMPFGFHLTVANIKNIP